MAEAGFHVAYSTPGAGAGGAGEAVAAATSDPRYKRAVERNIEAAIAAGVFGVPSFMLAGKLYFGNDRFELLERHLIEKQGR